jgi:hypothetical protein
MKREVDEEEEEGRLLECSTFLCFNVGIHGEECSHENENEDDDQTQTPCAAAKRENAATPRIGFFFFVSETRVCV